MIKRKLLEKIRKHIFNKEITLIVGARQAGKTTLMLLLKDELDKKGEKTLYLNLDIESHKEYFESQEKLIKKIELEIGKERGFVFIDEIQRKENAGLFLKGIYDRNLPYKFIVSGSGSVELKEKIHESLAGRKRVFHLKTLSFEEFVNYKTEYKYENDLFGFFQIEENFSEYLLEEYLNFGGYPRVVLEEQLDEKLEIINDIYQSYIIKDISYLLKVHKIEEFGLLVKILASQIGNLINLSEISSTIGISTKTLKDYLWYLEKTFIIKKLSPFFRNIRKEIRKAPIYYFYDIGMRNFALGIFGNLKDIKDKSFVFQNFIFNILNEKIGITSELYFWRTKEKSEVDFIIKEGENIIPVEVKYKKMKFPEITKSLRSFIEKYRPKNAFIVNLSLYDKLNFEGTEILIVPYYYFFKNDFSFQ